MKSSTRYRCSVGRAMALTAVACSVLLGAGDVLGDEAALTQHESYIAEYRRLGSVGKSEEREKLSQFFLAEAQAYITEHPKGPEIVQAKLNKALAIGLYGERREAEAEKLLKQIESTYPDSVLLPEVMYYHAWLLEFAPGGERDAEKRAIALDLVRRFPESEKAPYALSLAGHSYLVDAGDSKTASVLCRRVVKEYPGTGAELNARRDLIRIAGDAGNIASVQKQVDEFLDRFEEAPDIVPPESWASLLTGQVAHFCLRIRDWERAEICHRKVLEVSPDRDVARKALLSLARILRDGFNGKRAEESASVFLDVVERHPQSPEAPRTLIEAADCYEWYVRNKEKAAELFERAIADYPGTHEELEARVRLIVLALYTDESQTAEDRIQSLDQMLEEDSDADRARQGQLLLARELGRFYANNPSQTRFRDRALKRLQAIVEAHHGSEEAAEALLELALHYARPRDRDAEKATRWALHLLAENPESNRQRYARCVSEIMQDRLLLLEPLKRELPQRAQGLLASYPQFTSAERHSFLLKTDSFYGGEALERLAQDIIAFGRKHDSPQLVKDTMLFVAESYLRKERPREALRRLAAISEARVELSSADEQRLIEARAFSCLWCDKADMSIADLEELVARAPEPNGDDEGQLRTKAYYGYWLAVAWFKQGEYARSQQLFELLAQRYPRTAWGERAAQYADFVVPLADDG